MHHHYTGMFFPVGIVNYIFPIDSQRWLYNQHNVWEKKYKGTGIEEPTRMFGSRVQTVLQWLKHVCMGCMCIERLLDYGSSEEEGKSEDVTMVCQQEMWWRM